MESHRYLIATLAVAALAGCGSSGPSTTKVAKDAGAASCADSGYGIGYRTDNSKHTIWNCWINGVEVCVTDDNGIASNVTAEARVVFASSLGDKRPECVA